MFQKLKEKNQIILEEMDRQDQDLGIVEDLAEDNMEFYKKADDLKYNFVKRFSFNLSKH